MSELKICNHEEKLKRHELIFHYEDSYGRIVGSCPDCNQVILFSHAGKTIILMQEIESEVKNEKPKVEWKIVPAHGTVAEYEVTGDVTALAISKIIETIRNSGRWSLKQDGYGFWLMKGQLARRKY